MKLRTLRPGDADALLAFELANRAWFESKVEARPPGFYSGAGVAHHIADCLAKYEVGTMHPCLLVDDDDSILGRTNLRDIDAASQRAEIGYRIAQHACGRGLAGLALRHMLAQAYSRWQLASVEAYVTVNNPISAHILAKQGFQLVGLEPAHAEVAGQRLDCHHYRHLRV
ncbi:GNAT family N-acetyltransferase [Pseudoduganella violaceinigra]|uniref:GNAT family N-acetyltransferase n=1 Tax=Pseudoduganella violaceinigra TaxID=246602 RepID=UPI00040FC345|nr:GNAT family N-acetyltransferase [Pseudoduganella violaceinigra]